MIKNHEPQIREVDQHSHDTFCQMIAQVVHAIIDDEHGDWEEENVANVAPTDNLEGANDDDNAGNESRDKSGRTE